MATIFKNPHLNDYFIDVDTVRIDTPLNAIPSFVPQYKSARVLYFSGLKPEIDFDFWAALPTDAYSGFKKFGCLVDDIAPADQVGRAIERIGGPADLQGPLADNISRLLAQILPVYYRIFGGYAFSVKRAVWRLQTILNENLHFDTYGDKELPEQFARMFINLDNQPRIWHTSYTVDEAFEKFGRTLKPDVVGAQSDALFWHEFNKSVFGKNSRDWYDGQPRHVVYFDPGDVWVVDSRQVAHQIFYGRRAVSIDFVVPRDSMLDKRRHYLAIVDRMRQDLGRVVAA